MERLTEHSKQTSHENGICCTHFRGPECLRVGGNCAMNCKWEEAAWSRLAAYEDTRREPEEIDMDHEAAEQLRHLCRNCDIDRLEELAEADKNGRVVVLPRWKNEEERLERRRLMRIMADGAIDRLMENPLKEKNGPDIAELRVVNTDRLLELAKADEDGRLFLLPMEPGRSMLCQEYFERPWVMKNVTLCIQYQSSAGIIFTWDTTRSADLLRTEGSLPSHKREKKCWRGKRMFDINEVPYAEWLEKSLQAIVPLKPVSLCFAATMPDGEVYTGYYNADATDKAVIAHNIQADITMDIIRTNAAIIKDMIEHCEEDE